MSQSMSKASVKSKARKAMAVFYAELSKLSVKKIDEDTPKHKRSHSFRECENWIKEYFPDSEPHKVGSFATLYKFRDAVVGVVSMYDGTSFIAHLGNVRNYYSYESD